MCIRDSRYIDPAVMIQSKSTEIVLPAVVGGAAYIEGPLIGGLIICLLYTSRCV